MMLKVRAHTCYLGKTGYANHARSFFRELSDRVDLRVRNFTWDDDLSYINGLDEKIVSTITLRNSDGTYSDHPIGSVFGGREWAKEHESNPDVDIVLMDTDHHYFYEEYGGQVKIAYTVWESTRLPDGFFNRLKSGFDYLWVVSDWHKRVAVEQGYPEERIFVVNEGVDAEFSGPKVESEEVDRELSDGRFKFMFFGRWDYRKSVPEIIRTFLKTFDEKEPVDLVISADNPYAVDGMNSTEERLKKYGFLDKRIRVKHFLSRRDYLSYLQRGHALVTCARSEGWNIPLIEAMACGTPAIYSNWGAQLEFTRGEGFPVKTSGLKPANLGAKLGFAGECPGEYCEPDFEDLGKVMRALYKSDREDLELGSIKDRIIRQFSWRAVCDQAMFAIRCALGLGEHETGEAAVVMSHADTDEKRSVLLECVKTLKTNGLTVIVSSHIPVSDKINELADYVIYDRDNPIMTREEYSKYAKTVPVFYMTWPTWGINYSFDYDHGYAVLKLIRNGATTAIAAGAKKVHFVNYDYVIRNKQTLASHSNWLESSDLVVYRDDEKPDEKADAFSTGLFSAKPEAILKCFDPIWDKASYFQYGDTSMLEQVFERSARRSGLKLAILPEEAMKDGNIINSVIIETAPGIGKEKEDVCYTFLCEEYETLSTYLFLKGAIASFNAEIKIGEITADHTIRADRPTFIKVTNEDIKSGIRVHLKELNKTIDLDDSSNRGNCQIVDRSLIIDKEDLAWRKDAPNEIRVSFIEGAKIETSGKTATEYKVSFIDERSDTVVYSDIIKTGWWSACNREYWTPWRVTIEDLKTGEKRSIRMDLNGKRVLFSMESRSLGDTLAWFPYIEEFCIKHGCKGVVSTFMNSLFESEYPDLEFIKPGDVVHGIHAKYKIGWFYDGDNPNSRLNPSDFRNAPLQKTASDILGLSFKTKRPRVKKVEPDASFKKPYVCLGIHATAQAKYWNNPTGWQEVTDYLKNKGYDVVVLSLEENGYMGNRHPVGVIELESGRSLSKTMSVLAGADAFIGVGSGLSWLSWAMGKPTVIISGFSKPHTEPDDANVVRVFNSAVCNGCFNRAKLDGGDWNWCPDLKNTPRQFECSKSISAKSVIDAFNEASSIRMPKTIESIVIESLDRGMVQNYSEIYEAACFVRDLEIKNFLEIGTDAGGTFAIWSKLASKGKRISVDIPHGMYGRDDFDENERNRWLVSLGRDTGSEVHMISGSSHDESSLKAVEEILNGEHVDFLFIDGDHTYEGVKQDLEMYSRFVKPGGWVGFHDIKDTEYHRRLNCNVAPLWNELSGKNKLEFIDRGTDWGGIGFIQIEDVRDWQRRRFDWGKTNDWYQSFVRAEILERKIYEKHFQVKDGDVVLDLGASIGVFGYSILSDRNPKKIFCVEPSRSQMATLKNNVPEPVGVYLEYGIGNVDGISKLDQVYFDESDKDSEYPVKRFKTLLEENMISKIDFLKTDCEGGEYSVFNQENLEWIKANVKYIVGEWHLSTPEEKKKFIEFRETYLKTFTSHYVYSIDDVDIKWDLWNPHFLDYYKQVIIHIDNSN